MSTRHVCMLCDSVTHVYGHVTLSPELCASLKQIEKKILPSHKAILLFSLNVVVFCF